MVVRQVNDSRRTTNDASMKKPAIRVTKWLGDIPVEATCILCSNVSLRAVGQSHRPNREEYQRSLQAQFDEHLKIAHSETGHQ